MGEEYQHEMKRGGVRIVLGKKSGRWRPTLAQASLSRATPRLAAATGDDSAAKDDMSRAVVLGGAVGLEADGRPSVSNDLD